MEIREKPRMLQVRVHSGKWGWHRTAPKFFRRINSVIVSLLAEPVKSRLAELGSSRRLDSG